MAGRLGIVVVLAAMVASTALAAPGDAERRAIARDDQAWAKRVNLVLRDLPSGFSQGPPTTSSPTGRTCPGFSPDLSRFTITGEAVSRPFVRANGTSIFSAAEIFLSVADERGDWALTARREVLPCLRRELRQAAAGRAAAVTTTVLDSPRVGERSIWFRAGVRFDASGGARTTIWLDVLGVARGRGDATLGVVSVRTPPSAALERTLLRKLASRLRG
jgi:hypothetical protein